MVADSDDFDFEELQALSSDRIVLFILATYGQGEPTDNSIGFNKFLAASSASGADHFKISLQTLRYATFGGPAGLNVSVIWVSETKVQERLKTSSQNGGKDAICHCPAPRTSGAGVSIRSNFPHLKIIIEINTRRFPRRSNQALIER